MEKPLSLLVNHTMVNHAGRIYRVGINCNQEFTLTNTKKVRISFEAWTARTLNGGAVVG
jgi:hypothetical protein